MKKTLVCLLGLTVGLVVALMFDSSSVVAAPSTAGTPTVSGALECTEGWSQGGIADYFGNEGLPPSEAIAQGEVLLLGGRDVGELTKKVVETSDSLVVEYHQRTGRTVASITLARVGAGWRVESGETCVARETVAPQGRVG